jgi:ribosomal protein S18 acetylase RimI-like enzyme
MASHSLSIEAVQHVDESVVNAFALLLPQLSSAPPPDAAILESMVNHPGTTLLIAKDGDHIIGALTLQVFQIPTGIRAWIEDVVVDERARGQGAGAALVRASIEVARRAGALTVDLTSRPSRKDANALYRHLGFLERDTNVYRYSLEG